MAVPPASSVLLPSRIISPSAMGASEGRRSPSERKQPLVLLSCRLRPYGVTDTVAWCREIVAWFSLRLQLLPRPIVYVDAVIEWVCEPTTSTGVVSSGLFMGANTHETLLFFEQKRYQASVV